MLLFIHLTGKQPDQGLEPRGSSEYNGLCKVATFKSLWYVLFRILVCKITFMLNLILYLLLFRMWSGLVWIETIWMLCTERQPENMESMETGVWWRGRSAGDVWDRDRIQCSRTIYGIQWRSVIIVHTFHCLMCFGVIWWYSISPTPFCVLNYFTGTGTDENMWLPQCQWSTRVEYS